MDLSKELKELENTIKYCDLCKLCETRNKTVPGSGNINSRILVVGEGPGADEDEQGIPFVGKAGQLLTNIFNAVSLDRDNDMYITNIVKCRPPGNRDPEKDEIESCAPYLYYIIEIMQPQIIVTLGNPATRFFLNTREGITKLRGKTKNWNGITLVPMYHPSYIVRNENNSDFNRLKKETWLDIKLVRKIFDSL